MSNPIILTKGQTISLVKPDGANLNQCFVGLGWDIHKGESADLDAFAIELDDEGRKIDCVYFGHLTSNDGAIRHTGDNLTGEGEGDDEVINIDLNRVDARTRKIIIAVNIYRANLSFSQVQNAFVRLVDKSNNSEFSRYNLSQITGTAYTMYMADIVKDDNGRWSFRAVGNPTTDNSISQFTSNVCSGSVTGSATSNNSNNNRGGFFGRLFR
jgi:tellurium resistance protein TerZ